jgi:arabinogalactan endo-1,4-beta-galactosidase
MSANDRRQVLQILKKHKSKRKVCSVCNNSKATSTFTSESSENTTSSANKDLENWVMVHGKADKVVEDVRGIGKVGGSGGSKARQAWAVARASAQFFCNFLCKSL